MPRAVTLSDSTVPLQGEGLGWGSVIPLKASQFLASVGVELTLTEIESGTVRMPQEPAGPSTGPRSTVFLTVNSFSCAHSTFLAIPYLYIKGKRKEEFRVHVSTLQQGHLCRMRVGAPAALA
jgi:hypothetical protein